MAYETIISGTAPAITVATMIENVVVQSATSSGVAFPLGVTAAGVYPGGVRQIVNSYTGAYASGTASISRASIPQISAGTQFLSLAITPKSATSSLLITVSMMLAPAAPNSYQVAVFRDSTAPTIGCIGTFGPTANEFTLVTLFVTTPSTSTAATTFTVRAGTSTANTLYLNGNGGLVLGGSVSSGITIVEFGA